MYTVYQHKNKINGKVYIGITSQIPTQRWGANGKNYRSSPHFYSAIQKYGWDNFEHNILLENLSKEDACTKEQELIKKFNTMDKRFGYNQTSCGECFELSAEARIKKSKAMIGNKNGLGKPCSKEKADKIRNAQKGRHLSDEHKKKLSESAKKRHTPCSEDKRKTLQNSHPNMKMIYCEETNTIYKSVQECARQLDIYATNISKVCQGKIKTTKGYHLRYYNDTINA